MKNTLLLLSLAILISNNIFAQHYSNRNKVWTFGRQAGLDFTSGTPIPISSKIYHTSYTEGCASVCDTAGNLLFYTDGKKVYNKNNTIMPSGTSIVPFQTYSTSQAALIIPVIGSDFRYYLFSLQEVGGTDTTTCQLSYCVVDMTLDGGLGDIVPSSIGTTLNQWMSEKMIAIPGDNHNIWLLTHKRDTAIFLSYEITSAGINTTPVISTVGQFSGLWGYAYGVMKVSPDWTKVVCQNMVKYPMDSGCTELYDFNRATGGVSNCVVLDSAKYQYGAEFSPDNTKLYASVNKGTDNMDIFQYDLSFGTISAIQASRTLVHTVTTCGSSDLKLGPDNKIYLAGRDDSTDAAGKEYSRYLDCITKPNLPGTACGYISQALKLPDTAGIYIGLPNLVVDERIVSSVIDDGKKEYTLLLYPIPAVAKIYISASTKIEEVVISNILGKELFRNTYDSSTISIDISSFSADIYIVRVNGRIVKKLVKM